MMKPKVKGHIIKVTERFHFAPKGRLSWTIYPRHGEVEVPNFVAVEATKQGKVAKGYEKTSGENQKNKGGSETAKTED